MESLPFPATVALVGAGRVATAVSVLLARRGNRISGVSSRTAASARTGAARLSTEVFDHRRGIPEGTDVVLVGAGDPAIEEVARELSDHVEPGTIVWHLAGSVGTSVLADAIAAGALGAALHPVQACPDVDTAVERLPGSAWGVTCSNTVTSEWAGRAIRSLEGTPVRVAEVDRAAWHAAAATTSNGIAALLSVAETMLNEIGIRDPEKVLGPLAAGTVMNARDGGGGGRTLTGPVVRGEEATVARHIAALERSSEQTAAQYRQVAGLIVSAATRSGRISNDVAALMRELIGP